MKEEMSWEDRTEQIYKEFSSTIGDYHKFKKWMIERKHIGYNLDRYMITKLYKVYQKINNTNDDYFMVACGSEGLGKSTFLMHVCAMVDSEFSMKRVCFTMSDFIKQVEDSKPGQAIILDEGGTQLYSRQAMSQKNVLLTQLFTIMRQKNLFVAIAIPNFFILDRYVRLHRVNAVVNITTRGKYTCFGDARNRIGINKLNRDCTKSMSLDGMKPVPNTAWRGWFLKPLPVCIDNDDYVLKKHDHMTDLIEEMKEVMKTNNAEPLMIKTSEAAKLLGVTTKVLIANIDSGKVNGKKIGGCWYISRVDVNNLLKFEKKES